MRREGTCTAIALYELDKESVDLRGLFTFFEEWFLEQGYTPKRASVDGEGITATKTRTFRYEKKVMFEKDPKKLTGFWFGSYAAEDWGDDSFDAVLSVSIDIDDNFFDFYFHDSIIPFKRDLAANLVKSISQYLKSYYGIVYQRDFDKGPSLYASGIIAGLDGYRHSALPEIQKERNSIAEWRRRYFRPWKYHLGQLRDIYPMNLLSEAHLKEPVLGVTLKEWIESSSDHGELKPLTDILWEWWVPEDKISVVREKLKSTGVVICV